MNLKKTRSLLGMVKTLGMTRWAESPGAAREHDEPLLPTVRTPDAGETAAGIAAVKILLDHLLDDRPEKTVLPLETTLILNQEPIEIMEQHPAEDGPLRMSGKMGPYANEGDRVRNLIRRVAEIKKEG